MGAAGPRRTYHPLLHSDTFIALVRGLVTNDSTAVAPRRDGGARAGRWKRERVSREARGDCRYSGAKRRMGRYTTGEERRGEFIVLVSGTHAQEE